MVRDEHKDYGVDVSVEITRALPDSSQILSGKRISVQLKSSSTDKFDKANLSLSIPKNQIIYWSKNFEPFLLVYIDLKTECCYYRWIDEQLISELNTINRNWLAQSTVSIRFDKNLVITSSSLIDIERYVLNFKRNPKSILTPGNYFKFSQEAKNYIDEFYKKSLQFNINPLPKELNTLKNSTIDPIFTIAVAGPTKAGKSTLINCILDNEILPIGRLPTTGIPISIYPSTENKCTITFTNNSNIKGEANVNFISKYTTQRENNKNHKKVKLVNVEIVNSLLEKGFAICDMPGIDDADEEVREITQTALCSADAIVYVVSVATYASDDFSITDSMINDLNSLGGEMRKIFLVFNKIDALSANDLRDLQKYITKELTDSHILRYLPIEPLYISSTESKEFRKTKKGKKDTVAILENKIWEYLLANNKTGLYRLIDCFNDCLNLFERITCLLHARMTKMEERHEIEVRINSAKVEIMNFEGAIEHRKQSIIKYLQEYLISSLQGVVNYLNEHLNGLSLDQNLPTNSSIVKWLENHAHSIFSKVNSLLQQEALLLHADINDWIQRQMNLISIKINAEGNILRFENTQIYSSQINYAFHPKIAQSGIKRVFAEIEEVIMSIITIVEDTFTAKGIVRKKQIEEIMQKSTQAYNIIYSNFLFNLNSRVNYVCCDLKMKSIDRAEIYLDGLLKQLSLLDQPLTSHEHNNFAAFLYEIKRLEIGIKSNLNHLKDYTSGIV